jgi:ATP-dependent Clp protease ATP-binding subunit ClpC
MGEKKNYSYELQEVLTYMIDVLANEFPTDVFTPEYLIVSILDTKRCHANLFLDNYLMSNNIDELREIYTSVLKNNKKPVMGGKDKSKVEFDFELNKIMETSETEANKLNSPQVGTEHVLLAILNPDNNIKIQEVFRTVGIDYELIFSKCKGSKKEAKSQRKRNFINNNGGLNMTVQQPVIPLKSEVNATSPTNMSEGEFTKKYTTNINELVKKGKLDKLIGRNNELNQIIKVLARRKKNNAILVGHRGVGKTSIVYGLAQMIESGEVPTILEGKQIVSIDIMALVSGTHFRGMFEERVKGLFDELRNNDKFILFIDDMQNVLKGSGKDKDTDISSMIGDILSEGDVRVIGTTNFKDYRNSIESNPTISNKLQRIIIEPSTKQEAINILNENKKYYEEFHGVEYTEDAIKKCVELSERYISDRCLPDSAFDVLDMAGAYASLAVKNSEEFTSLKKRLNEIEVEKNDILNNGEFEKIDAITIEENDVKKRIAEFKRREKSGENKNIAKVDENKIAETVSEMTNIPISKLSSSEKEKVAHIDELLKKSIIGQDEAIEEVSRVIKRNKVGLGDKTKTIANILCLGESGCGKTLLAKKLAEEIFGDEKALVRIDMSEYSEKSSVAKLTGAAPGYIGYENGGQLTEAIKNKQHCVLLLDEIEKADQEVYNLFLQLFDDGRLTDSSGQIVNFKNVIVIMTSNVGAKAASEFGGGVGFVTDEGVNKKSIIEKELKQKFTPEFLNRLDKIVYFNRLTDDNLRNIVKLEINKFGKRLKELNYDIKYDESVVNYIHEQALKQKEFGARPIIRLIQNNLEDTITDLILEHDYEPEYAFSATCKDNNISIR